MFLWGILILNIVYKENVLTANDFILLHKKMGLAEFSIKQVKKSMAHNLFSIVAVSDDEIIGMGRLLGDGALFWYINDILVLTEHQGKGIGRDIVKGLIQYIKENSILNTSVTIYLFCAKDKEGFYEKLGFADSCKHGGIGMFLDIDV
jgi:GNAT superfamily N-acetyltransferase